MEPKVTITINEMYENGKVCVKTFRIRDINTLKNITEELAFCKLMNEYSIYPDRR